MTPDSNLFRGRKAYRDPSRSEPDRERWIALCNEYGLREVAEIAAYYVKTSDASSLDLLFTRFFDHLTMNLHLKLIDRSAAAVADSGGDAIHSRRERRPGNRSERKIEVFRAIEAPGAEEASDAIRSSGATLPMMGLVSSLRHCHRMP